MQQLKAPMIMQQSSSPWHPCMARRQQGQQQPLPRHSAVERPPLLLQTWLQGELIVRGDRLGLDELPAALYRKHALRELALSHNRLQDLPPAVGRLKQLQVGRHTRRGGARQRPAGLARQQPPSWDVPHGSAAAAAGQTRTSCRAGCLAPAHATQVLRLDHNRLELLPPEVCQLEALHTLDCAGNRLQRLPLGLCGLLHLTQLRLEGNPLGAQLAPGLTFRQAWERAGGHAADSPAEQQPEQPGAGPGTSSGASTAAATATATALAPAGAAAAATVKQQQLADCTDALLAALLEQLPADEAAAIKQRKYALLMQAARDRVASLVRVADRQQIESCLLVAEGPGGCSQPWQGDRASQHVCSKRQRCCRVLCKQRLPCGATPGALACPMLQACRPRSCSRCGWR
jgi:hypothetical protein